MTRSEVIETLCILMRDVHEKVYGWSTAADCFCPSHKPLSYQNTGQALIALSGSI